MTPDFEALTAEVNDRDKLTFKPVGSGARWVDLNAVNRSRVITGLQYSDVELDTETLTFLLEQEILRAENDPFQGMGEDLEYTAYLLCQKRDPNHAHLFLRAKRANFDCHCGFDSLYVVSSGLETLRSHLKSGDPPGKAGLIEFLDGFEVDEDEMQDWRDGKAQYFTQEWSEESPSYRISRLQYLGLEELARLTLEQWESMAPKDLRELQNLRRVQKDLEKFASAIETSEAILEMELSQEDRVSEWGEKTDSLCQDGRAEEAFESLNVYLDELKQIKNWNSWGYGREACKRAFVLALQNFPKKQQTFALAEGLQKRLTSTPLAILELAYLAARSEGPTRAAQRYETLAVAEADRIQQDWDPEVCWSNFHRSSTER